MTVEKANFHTQDRENQASMNFSSEDYDNSGYSFHFLDKNDGKNLPEEDIISLPIAGSSLQDHFDYSNRYRFETRNELEISRKVASREDSMKGASLDNEMETIDIENSFESIETSRDEDQLRGDKGAQSFFDGIIKKSFKDLSKSSNTVEESSSGVIINGNIITDKLLKRAEKVAGPVHPGQYWYDFRAGFWGMMGGPCLGIVPPFIEEFNHPMPENCSCGNTSVFVNGRELHPKDLNLLSNRGLPSTEYRSYVIEVSGRVLDEDTGEELPSLGKLAPTVEKVKHGFGMKVPRIAA